MATLTIETQYDVYNITQFPVRIGKAVDNDIVLRALGVADYHAIIENSAEGLQIRTLEAAHLNGKPIRSRVILNKNGFLTVGSRAVKLWLNPKAPMPDPARRALWKPLTHPACAITWFILALIPGMLADYLATQSVYLMNWRLLFYSGIALLALVWVIHSMILPFVRRYLLTALLGIISALSLLGDGLDWLFYQLSFQLNVAGLSLLSHLLIAGIFVVVFRAFFRDFIPLAGKLLTRYTLAIMFPCFLLLAYNYLAENDFFGYRAGRFPNYSSILMPHKILPAGAVSIEEFLSLDHKAE